MLGLIGLFVLSPIIAWLVQSGFFGWQPDAAGGKNRGELIHPAIPLERFSLQDQYGKPVVRESFLGKWSLLLISQDQCVNECEKNVYHLRQVWLALGKDADRAQRIVLTNNPESMAKLMSDNPGTNLYVFSESSDTMLTHFPGYDVNHLSAITGRVFIIDPLANLMMQYPASADPSDILKDMKQLLKATWIRPVQ
jgi:cytochrome oxidase Cu insertion factor (SCO1/SenC/PrrC family)